MKEKEYFDTSPRDACHTEYPERSLYPSCIGPGPSKEGAQHERKCTERNDRRAN